MAGAIREFVSGTATTLTTKALKRERSLQSSARTETDLSYSTILQVTSSMPRLQLTPLWWLLFAAAGTQATQHLVGLRVNAVHPASIDLGTGVQRGTGHLHHSSFNKVSNNTSVGTTTATTTPTATHMVHRGWVDRIQELFKDFQDLVLSFPSPNKIFFNETQEQKKKILLREENVHVHKYWTHVGLQTTKLG